MTGVGLLGQLTFASVVAEQAGPTKLAVTYYSADARVAQISINGGLAADSSGTLLWTQDFASPL